MAMMVIPHRSGGGVDQILAEPRHPCEGDLWILSAVPRFGEDLSGRGVHRHSDRHSQRR